MLTFADDTHLLVPQTTDYSVKDESLNVKPGLSKIKWKYIPTKLQSMFSEGIISTIHY